MSGVVFYLLTCFQGPMHALRARQRHRVEDGLDSRPRAHAVLGAFSFFAIAGSYYVVPRIFKKRLFSRRDRQLELLADDGRAGWASS